MYFDDDVDEADKAAAVAHMEDLIEFWNKPAVEWRT